ncbi:putative damage-inducible protein DinB [Prauserella isguenensis]|uniref:Putative damage-inducible protein DinB n=1 Tax=Prauserella isguenensis TaxID=1470180 RepID=A0A839RX74_9PSEU|nr:DinB family protein [Prauserella isguenensis]MBB3049440.1 putative damage-inducible protein DinB [Prauserella isguenensis]
MATERPADGHVSVERQRPPTTADEATTLAAWLDFYRDTLALKCEGLDEPQLRTASAPPSELTLLGLVQHLTEVERAWFRRTLAGEDVPSVYPSTGGEHDEGFDLLDDVSAEQAMTAWREEIAVAKRNCAGRVLDSTAPFHGMEVSLRWIYTHMIAEYARHAGHADLLRERIDGGTGV